MRQKTLNLNPILLVAVMGSLALLTSSAFGATPVAEPVKSEPLPWNKKMQELYRTLAELLTDVTSEQRFKDPANQARIQKEADTLAGLAHDLNRKGVVSLDLDPTVKIVGSALARETRRAAFELKKGNRDYARSILRSVPNYCIACHTRNSTGPQFSELAFEPSSKSLSHFERGSFFSATRQFDRAQVEFKKVIEDKKMASKKTSEWERAVREALTIAVRAKKSPDEASEIVKTILSLEDAPLFLKNDAKTWEKSIAEWKAEPKSEKTLSEDELYKEAIRLTDLATSVQKYPMDHLADVLYLRASSAIHDLLQSGSEKHGAEALLLAGVSYEILSPSRLEFIHELYYEMCIRKAPHTPIAEACYLRLESNILLGFTGSSGTSVPDDELQRMRDLRKTAHIEFKSDQKQK